MPSFLVIMNCTCNTDRALKKQFKSLYLKNKLSEKKLNILEILKDQVSQVRIVRVLQTSMKASANVGMM
jgi:hypothetical protein